MQIIIAWRLRDLDSFPIVRRFFGGAMHFFSGAILEKQETIPEKKTSVSDGQGANIPLV